MTSLDNLKWQAIRTDTDLTHDLIEYFKQTNLSVLTEENILDNLMPYVFSALVHTTAAINQANGFVPLGGGTVTDKIACIGLIMTELAEMIEVLRKAPDEDVEQLFYNEGADVIIRLCDLFSAFRHNGLEKANAFTNSARLGMVVKQTLQKNAKRGYRHGGKRA